MRHEIARVPMKKTEGGYVCTAPIYGFSYGIEVRKLGEVIELRVFDGPVADGWELPGVDVA